MIYTKGTVDGQERMLIVIETGNILELKKGRPLVTPDKSVCVMWTPDMEWLAQEVARVGRDGGAIIQAVVESLARPEKLRPACRNDEKHVEVAPPQGGG